MHTSPARGTGDFRRAPRPTRVPFRDGRAALALTIKAALKQRGIKLLIFLQISSHNGTIVRNLNTFVCAGFLSASISLPAAAQVPPSPATTNEANQLTNAQLLKLSTSELRYWVHGAFSGLGHGLIHTGNQQGHCIWNWYFGAKESRFATIRAAFERYPNAGPSSTIVAIADRVCPPK
jgi:hypothetical protein